MGYFNPLLALPSSRKILALPAEQRAPLEALFRELRAEADSLAEESWRKRKGPMAAYWRAVSTYARHTAHALAQGRPSREQRIAALRAEIDQLLLEDSHEVRPLRADPVLT